MQRRAALHGGAAAGSRHTRGLSLIEAMVALAVMGFGTLAVLGVQTGLRYNGDVSKQRGEAVRIAQETLEQARAFATLADYTALASVAATDAAGYTTNTTFQIVQDVLDDETTVDHPRRKTLRVQVSWQDRTGRDQSVQLQSDLQGTPPALAGTLLVPSERSMLRRPAGRNPAIPLQAVPHGEGTSRFAPPGAGIVSWVFNNSSGHITGLCDNAGTLAETCVDFDARLLAGFVRFSTDTVQPLPAATEAPQGLVEAVEVEVAQTEPAAIAGTVPCFEATLDSATRAYYCAVPLDGAGAWSGRSGLTGLTLAPSVADANDAKFRVCRYTPYRDHRAVGSGSPPMTNADHPLDYVGVSAGLGNQNFFVIRAGFGGTAFNCPEDGPSPISNTNTWHHQPSS
jgi:Tfp pilus assembly protein PilV